MGRQILFVTYQNEDFDEGLSYAVDLAKTMNKDLTILMVHRGGRPCWSMASFLNRLK